MKKLSRKFRELIPSIDKLRHVVKSISYRFYSTCITIVIASFVTGNTKLAFAIGVADFIIKIFTYYIHERIWFYIPFGLQKPRRLHIPILWDANQETDDYEQIEFLESEDKNIRKRIRITKNIKDSYRAILSTLDKNTNKRYSAIFLGTKEDIENKLNIKLK